uniref:8.9 kDa family member n=1 Tax=Rhipicephalus zambeziensis TaxID=60191 RepID=A0A224YKC7_9ACAR
MSFKHPLTVVFFLVGFAAFASALIYGTYEICDGEGRVCPKGERRATLFFSDGTHKQLCMRNDPARPYGTRLLDQCAPELGKKVNCNSGRNESNVCCECYPR